MSKLSFATAALFAGSLLAGPVLAQDTTTPPAQPEFNFGSTDYTQFPRNAPFADGVIPQTDPRVRATLNIAFKYMIQLPNGESQQNQESCTAVLVNNATSNPQADPMIVTAAHCFFTNLSKPNNGIPAPGESFDLATYWDVDNAFKKPDQPPQHLVQEALLWPNVPTRFYHVTVRAQAGDTILLALNAPPPAGARYSAWDAAPIQTGEDWVNINHSGGLPAQGMEGIVSANEGPGDYPSFTLRSVNYESGYAVAGASGSPSFHRSSALDNEPALRAISTNGGNSDFVIVQPFSESLAGDGSQTGSFGFWLAPGSAVTSAPGLDAVADPATPEMVKTDSQGNPLPPPPPVTDPGTPGPSGSGNGKSGGGAFGGPMLLLLASLPFARRRFARKNQKPLVG